MGEQVKTTTEEDILSVLGEEDFEADAEREQEELDVEGNEQDESSTDGSTEQSQATESTKTGNKDDNADKLDDKGSKGDNQEQSSRGPQDLVDGAGNVIAKGGKERRFYETAQREKQRADGFERELSTTKAKLEAYEATNNIGRELGITQEEVVSGARILAAYRS